MYFLISSRKAFSWKAEMTGAGVGFVQCLRLAHPWHSRELLPGGHGVTLHHPRAWHIQQHRARSFASVSAVLVCCDLREPLFPALHNTIEPYTPLHLRFWAAGNRHQEDKGKNVTKMKSTGRKYLQTASWGCLEGTGEQICISLMGAVSPNPQLHAAGGLEHTEMPVSPLRPCSFSPVS